MSSRQRNPYFNADQIFGMVASGRALDTLDAATRDHITKYDPADDPHPNLVSMDKFLAEEQIAMRSLALPLADAILNVGLQRRFANVDPEPFAKSRGSLRGPGFTPYRRLQIAYTGLIHVGVRGTGSEDTYTAYRIHEPQGLLHNLGIIIGTTMVHRREVMPIDRDSEFGEAVKIATQRLYTIAANTEEQEDGEQFEQIADNARVQESIISDAFEEVGGYRILTATEAAQLKDTLNLAVTYHQTLP